MCFNSAWSSQSVLPLSEEPDSLLEPKCTGCTWRGGLGFPGHKVQLLISASGADKLSKQLLLKWILGNCCRGESG